MTYDSFKIAECIISSDPGYLEILRTVRGLALPDWAIGAGFVRNRVWDHLHGYSVPSPLADVDVLFFDPADTRRERETAIEARLRDTLPACPWSVRNQARMHIRNGDSAYAGTLDAMASWLETATCVAVRLDADDARAILAPFGVDDLVSMKSAPTPAGRRKPEQYAARMIEKNWPAIWPRVRIAGLDSTLSPEQGRRACCKFAMTQWCRGATS